MTDPAQEHDWEQSTIRVGPMALSALVPAAPAVRRPNVVLHEGGLAGQRFELNAGRLSIGRAPDCDISLGGLGISRRHAELQNDDQRCVLVDLGSANGSYVNDRRVAAPTLLADGDLIRIGPALLRYHERIGVDAALQERLLQMAAIDPGTGAQSRRHWTAALAAACRGARHGGTPLSIACMDLDHFKSVNDRFGHAAGDEVLRRTVETLRALLRPEDLLGRIGGEEFAILLPGLPRQRALAVAEGLRAAVALQSFRFADLLHGSSTAHRQTASFGIACAGEAAPDADSLLRAADRCLYAAKRAGRDRVEG